MLKKILLVLDHSEAGQAAKRYAMDLAKRTKCHLTALSVLDTPWITAAQPEPLGGSIFKIQRDEALIQQSHEQILHLLKQFKEEANDQGIQVTALEGEGFPAVVIERLSHEHDLIVIGKTTDLHFDLEENSDIVVQNVARDNPRPVLIVPCYPVGENKNTILVTQDGSNQASRALHMLLLLGLAEHSHVEVLSIHKDPTLAEKIAGRGVRMCESYGIKATPCALEETHNISDHILERIKTIHSRLVCLGGFSHSALKDAIFGSSTNRILKQANIPLFIHH